MIKKDEKLVKWVNDNTLSSSDNFADKVYSAMSQESNKCKYNKLRPFKNIKLGYLNCGNEKDCKCLSNHLSEQRLTRPKKSKSEYADITLKSRTTKLEKYGDANYCNPSKIKSTKLAKYSDANYCNPSKIKSTKLAKYSDATFNNRIKASQTKLAKYGDANYCNAQQRISTCLEKYSTKGYGNVEKGRLTKLEKYGDQAYTNRKKAANTSKLRYGVEYFNQSHISEDSRNKLTDATWMSDQHHNKNKTLTEIAANLAVDITTVSNYMKTHNLTVVSKNVSFAEKNVVLMINENIETVVIQNTRNIIPPKEIDIYLPEFHLAIEFNGTYWHRPEVYGGYDGWLKYHQSKIDLCAKKGIQLLHLWENYDDHLVLIEQAISGNVDNDLSKVLSDINWL